MTSSVMYLGQQLLEGSVNDAPAVLTKLAVESVGTQASNLLGQATQLGGQAVQKAVPFTNRALEAVRQGGAKVLHSFPNQSPAIRALLQGAALGIPSYLIARLLTKPINWLTNQELDPHRVGMAAGLGAAAFPIGAQLPFLALQARGGYNSDRTSPWWRRLGRAVKTMGMNQRQYGDTLRGS